MSIDHIINKICNSRIQKVILIGNNNFFRLQTSNHEDSACSG